jgi:hypothetical protein
LPATPHVEQHFTGSESVRDVVIGMADGLTVPFALAAGLSAAVTSSHIIVTAGLAEVAAGAIAMGLGGYLAARTDQEHYASEERREHQEVQELRQVELDEVATIFRGYGLEGPVLDEVTAAIASDQKRSNWAWNAQPAPCTDQRFHHCDLLYCGRSDSPNALYPWLGIASGTYLLCGRHRCSAGCLRCRKGKTYRNQHCEVGLSNNVGRWFGRGRCILFGIVF